MEVNFSTDQNQVIAQLEMQFLELDTNDMTRNEYLVLQHDLDTCSKRSLAALAE